MVCDNDKTIFKYLNSTGNEMLSKIKENDLKEILYYLDRYYLEYRDSIGVSSDITFGIEIEMEHFKGGVLDFWPFEVAINEIVGNEEWIVKNDITLNWGREIASDILIDIPSTWTNVKNVCDYSSKYAEIDIKCASHVNIGSQIFGNNTLYWFRFLKLWSIYENIIYRFGYGEYLTHFPFITYSAMPISKLFFDELYKYEEMIDSRVFNLINILRRKDISIDFLKKNAVSFFKMYNFDDYSLKQKDCVVEIRNCLGTLNCIVWQNYINFFIKMMLYCKSDCFDDEILNRRKFKMEGINSNIFAYSKIYLDQALELSDMIFDNNLDKIYFLRQYLKCFDITDKTNVLAKKFTM